MKSIQALFSIEVNLPNDFFANFFCPALPASVFSKRIILYSYMEVGLPTLVSHQPSWGMRLCSREAYPHPKVHLQVLKISKFRQNHFLIKSQNVQKCLTKITLGNSHLAKT